MFEIGWAELLVIGVVALIVIGPEDLPEMFRTIGRFTAKARQMGREFQRAMDQAAKEAGVKDVAKDLATIASPKAMGLDAIKSAADQFEKWDPIKNAAKPTPAKVAATSVEDEAAADAADAALSANRDLALAAMSPPPAAGTPMALTTPSSLTSVAAMKAEQSAAENTAAVKTTAEKVAENSVLGPATKALRDKQAARKAVLDESAAKLKAIDAGAIVPTEAAPKAKPRAAKPAASAPEPAAKAPLARKSAAAAATSAPAPEPAPKARASRKTAAKKGDKA
jgi:sec-independent protein translocase protein TatB